MSANQLQVINGGNKYELLAQLGDIGRICYHRPTFRLEVEHPLVNNSPSWPLNVHVNGISAEDGSGESWIIEGYAFPNIDWLEREFGGEYRSFHGLFNTRTRKGSVCPGIRTR